MKKTKKIIASLLSLVMCGSFFLTGCDLSALGIGGSSSSSSATESSGESSSVGESSSASGEIGGGEIEDEVEVGEVATETQKKTFYEAIKALGTTAMTPGTTLKITLDLDLEAVMGGEAVTPTPKAATEATPKMGTLKLDGTAYYKLSEEAETEGLPFLDATIKGSMIPSQVPYMYAAAYMRGDDLYSASKDGMTEVTDLSGVKYTYSTASGLIEQLGSMMGGSDQGETDGALDAELHDKKLAARTATAEPAPDSSAAIAAMISAIAEKALSGAFVGLGSNVKTEGDVTTLTVNFLKEAKKLLALARLMTATIDADTTVADLLASEQVEELYNQYFGDLTAEELYTVMTLAASLMAAAPPATTASDSALDESVDETEGDFDISALILAPNENEEGFDYLVRVISGIPLNLINPEIPEGVLVGDFPLGEEVKTMISGYITMTETYLKMVNSAKISMSMTNGVFSGVTVDLDIKDTADIDLSVGIVTVTDYRFVDVTALELFVTEE